MKNKIVKVPASPASKNTRAKKGKGNKRTVQSALTALFLSVFFVLGNMVTVIAQTGTISGEVTDAETGESLPGANIIIDGTTYGATTDIDGRYTLRRAPVGEHTVTVRYMGYDQQSFDIIIEDGERMVLNAALQPAYIEGAEVLVQSVQRGQARSLTRQRQSVNIRNIVSAEQIDRFADQTVEGALQRIAGMGHGGQANIRGIGGGMSRVTVDGQRMGSTSENRSVDLSTISADMVQELDVIKVITPDMSADALSGVINISTRRPIGGERTMNVRGGGGYQPRYGGHTGPGYRMSLSYGDSPDDTYSYGLNLSYQRQPRGEESFSTSWATRNLDEPYGISDVLSTLSAQYEYQTRDRYGIGGQFTFQPSQRTTYHLQGMFNYQDRFDSRYGKTTNPRNDAYITPTETGRIPGQTGGGSISFNTRFRDYSIYQATLQAGARHLFDNFDMEYKVGWGHGRNFRDQYNMSWGHGPPGFNFFVNMDDRWYPTVDIAPGATLPYPNSDRVARSDFLTHSINSHIDNEVSATVDFDFPYSFGTVKFGGGMLSTFQRGNEEVFSMDYDARVGPGAFSQMLRNTWNVMDRDHLNYTIPYMIDADKFIDSYHSRRAHMIKDVDRYSESESEFFYGNENVFSTYAMTQFSYNFVTVLGGARVEHTYASYEAREGIFSEAERFLGSVPIHAATSYTHLFPNAQLIVRLTDFTNFRAAYSKSIGRPRFTQLSPYRQWDYANRSVSHGNPDLRPMVSDNIDLLFEHYFMNVGQITVGVFYKRLADFVFSETRRVQQQGITDMDLPRFEPEYYIGWDRSTFRNGEEADVYGLEFSWQQTLSFLPGFLSYLGTYANYTYTYSVADIGRLDDAGEAVLVRLQNQRPHVVNFGLDYTRGNFAGQISYQWSDPYVSSYRSTREWVPTIQLRERVYTDSYTDGANDLSLTLRYRITDNIRIWMNGSNLTNSRTVNYIYDRDFYPTSQSLRGTELTLGVQIAL